MIQAATVAVTTTGSAGSATGNADSPQIRGEVLGLWVNYHASAPGTTDITITDKLSGQTLYSKANSATDVYIPLRVFGLKSDGTALTSDVTPQKYAIAAGINVALAGCDALTDAVKVTLVVES